jgi:Whirly transcription factor
VNELGALIHSFGAGGQGALELLHDPNAGTTSAGKDRDAFKKLKAARMPDGAIMFSIFSGNQGYNLPVSHAEMVVLLELARFTIPRALGFDKGMEASTQ